MGLNPQAAELNETITAANPHVFTLLSDRGRNIYFPKQGILSQSAEAAGSKINATIGTALEDDGSPMSLESIRKHVSLPAAKTVPYAPNSGKPEIRKAWKEMLAKKNPSLAGKSLSSPVVTSALTHGLSMTGYLFVNEDDEIISPDLYWENYDLVFDLAYGGKITTFPTFTNSHGFNVDGLAKTLMGKKPGKRIVLLNFPNNPTGYTVTEDEAIKIREVFVAAADRGNDILVIVDDAYFGLVFEEGILRESMFGLLADAHERLLAVKLDGPTKEDYVWGFRIGFVTFGIKNGNIALYGALEAKLGGAIRGNISNSSNLGQAVLLAAYDSKEYEREKTEKYEILKRRYEKIRDLFAAHPEYTASFTPLPFNSGYFMCVRLTRGKAEAVRKLLIEKFSTGLVAQGEDTMRIAFSSTPFEKLDSLFHNLFEAAKEIG